jgi:hypothetical protein
VYIDELLFHPNGKLLIAHDEFINDKGSNIKLSGRSTPKVTLAHVILSFLSIIELDFVDFIPCFPKNKIINITYEFRL